MATDGEAQTSRFEADMDTGMARMMQDMHSPGYSGQPDSGFLAMMIPHHEGAVDMARLVLIHGRDPMVRQIAGDHCQPDGGDCRDAWADGCFAGGAESGARRVFGAGGCAGWRVNARGALKWRARQVPDRRGRSASRRAAGE